MLAGKTKSAKRCGGGGGGENDGVDGV